MAVTASPIFPQTIQNYSQTYVAADTSTVKTIATGGTDGTKIEWVNISSNDTTARDVQFWLSDGTTNYLLTTVALAANSGFTNAIVPVSLFNSTQSPFFTFDSNGNRYLYLKSGWSLKAGTLTTVTAAKTVYVTAQGADF